MNDARLLAWRRRLGISRVMEQRLRRMVNAVAREEREACMSVALDCNGYATREQIANAIRKRKP